MLCEGCQGKTIFNSFRWVLVWGWGCLALQKVSFWQQYYHRPLSGGLGSYLSVIDHLPTRNSANILISTFSWATNTLPDLTPLNSTPLPDPNFHHHHFHRSSHPSCDCLYFLKPSTIIFPNVTFRLMITQAVSIIFFTTVDFIQYGS